MKNLFTVNRILAFLLAVLLAGNATASTVIEVRATDVEDQVSALSAEQENAPTYESGSYTYIAPDEGSFLIENADGILSITDGVPILHFEIYTVSFPVFDYYRVVNENGDTRFYQADVLNPTDLDEHFVYISILSENDATHTIYVHYKIEAENKLYNISAILSPEQLQYFDQLSVSLCLGADEISQRLKSSARTYTYGTFESEDLTANATTMNTTNGNSVATMALNPIADNTYDAYTDSDGIIRSYVDSYFGEYKLEDGVTISDDPIVNIVPKELCFILGEHIYVGKEYGFFIRVVADSLSINDFAVDIMVFDIIYTTPNPPYNNEGGAMVEPLFQYKYRATERSGTGFDPSLSSIVFPHLHYDFAEYFLKDVGFKFTLENANALNPGDSGYDPYEDDGAFIIETRANARGVGLKKKDKDFLDDTASFAIGFIPYVGTALSVYSYMHDVYNGFGNGEYYGTYPDDFRDNEANIDTYATNNTDQIQVYGSLIKSQSVAITPNPEKPRLIHVGGGYVEGIYVISRKSGSSNNKTRVITSVSVSVVEDNTTKTIFGESGELVEYGRAIGTYETGNYKRLDDVSLNGSTSVTIPADTQKFIIKLVPAVSGTYKLFTTSSAGDPNFNITDAIGRTSAVAATDDINGANDRNAALTINLVRGNIYYINAYSYNSAHGYTLHMGYAPSTGQTVTPTIPYSITNAAGSYQMLKFTATSTGVHTISTSKTSGDPQVFLFSSTGVLLNSDDDSGGNLNAYLEHFLIAGQTYYLAVQGYRGNAATFTVLISLPKKPIVIEFQSITDNREVLLS